MVDTDGGQMKNVRGTAVNVAFVNFLVLDLAASINFILPLLFCYVIAVYTSYLSKLHNSHKISCNNSYGFVICLRDLHRKR